MMQTLLLLALLAAPPTATVDEKPGAPTPQRLVERYNAAVARRELAPLVDCLAPDDRAVINYSVVKFFLQRSGLLGNGTVPETAAAQDVAAVLRRNGLGNIVEGKPLYSGDQVITDPNDREGIRKRLRDVFAREGGDLLAGLMAAGHKHFSAETMADVDAIANMFPAGPMSIDTLSLDRGTAKVSGHSCSLIRIDGRWYITDLLDIRLEAKAK